MGRTLPSFTQIILNEQAALAKFRRALRHQDRDALDDLFRAARFHVAALAYASHLLPFESALLAMLLEEHKRVTHLETLLESLLQQNPSLSGVGTVHETLLQETPALPSADDGQLARALESCGDDLP